MTMTALLWKDMRVNRDVLAFGAVFLTMPYLIFLICGLFGTWSNWWHFEPLLIFANISMLLSTITFALLGGYAFAAERADRSAEFLAYLPPSRLAIVTSKAVFAVGVGLVQVFIHERIILFLALSPRLPGAPGVVDSRRIAPYIAVTILMFGVAWLCSTFASGPALAAGCGILLSMGVTFGTYYSQRLLPVETVTQYYRIFCMAGGVTCFVAGTVYYIRRFAP